MNPHSHGCEVCYDDLTWPTIYDLTEYIGRHRLSNHWGWRWFWDKPMFRINLDGGAFK